MNKRRKSFPKGKDKSREEATGTEKERFAREKGGSGMAGLRKTLPTKKRCELLQTSARKRQDWGEKSGESRLERARKLSVDGDQTLCGQTNEKMRKS